MASPGMDGKLSPFGNVPLASPREQIFCCLSSHQPMEARLLRGARLLLCVAKGAETGMLRIEATT